MSLRIILPDGALFNEETTMTTSETEARGMLNALAKCPYCGREYRDHKDPRAPVCEYTAAAAIDGPRSIEDIVRDIEMAEGAAKQLPTLRAELDERLKKLGVELRRTRKTTKGTTP